MLKFYKTIKKWIKAHRRRIGKSIFFETLCKKKGVEARCREIEILALGSSHCANGFDATLIPNAFNLGNPDQDLYTTCYLFHRYLPELTNLKHLIVFYSVFSPGHELAKTTHVKQVALNHYVFGTPYDVEYLPKWEKAIRHRYQKFDDSHIDYQTFSGFFPCNTANQMTTEERVSKHLRENQRGTNQTKLLLEIARTCQDKGIQMTVVIPPFRSDYNYYLKQSGLDLFQELYQAVTPPHDLFNFLIINQYVSNAFDDEDFSDSDHLNAKGAKKLTHIIYDFINKK